MVRLRFRKSWLLFPMDLLFVVFTTYFSFQLRFNFSVPSEYHHSLESYLFIRPIVYLVAFVVFRMYTRLWRYAGTSDLEAIILANGSAAIIVKLMGLLVPGINYPLSVWLSGFLLTVALTGGSRLAYRIYAQRWLTQKSTVAKSDKENVLIYGAGAAGAIVSREMVRDKGINQNVIGFIDDDLSRSGMTLNGSRVFGDKSRIPLIVENSKVDQILVAIPSLSRAKLAELVGELQQYKVPIYIIPPFTRWMVDNLWGQAKPVDVEDLLGRDPLPVDIATVGTYLSNAVVLVTGAGGVYRIGNMSPSGPTESARTGSSGTRRE